MTKEEIDALEERFAAAEVADGVSIERRDRDGGDIDFIVYGTDGDTAACFEGAAPRAKEKAELIAALINSFPALIAEVREAGARELERAAEECRGWAADERTGYGLDGDGRRYQRADAFDDAARRHLTRAASLRKDAR